MPIKAERRQVKLKRFVCPFSFMFFFLISDIRAVWPIRWKRMSLTLSIWSANYLILSISLCIYLSSYIDRWKDRGICIYYLLAFFFRWYFSESIKPFRPFGIHMHTQMVCRFFVCMGKKSYLPIFFGWGWKDGFTKRNMQVVRKFNKDFI